MSRKPEQRIADIISCCGIEWKKIAGMRDWLSHVYYRVDPDIVWDAVVTKVPELLRTLQAFKEENQP